MKKFSCFAIALVACALAFTSCETKIDSPLVGGWNTRGTLVEIDPSDGSQQVYEVLHSLSFFDNGQFQHSIYYYDGQGYTTANGYVTSGTWSVKENKVTIRTEKSGKIRNNEFIYDSSFKPTTDEATWRIEGHYLYLIYASDGREETYRDGKP